MSISIFETKTVEPTEDMLATELGESKSYLDAIRSHILNEYNDLTPEWKYYGQKSGWVLKLLNKKRNLLFVVPCKGYFKASLVFGEKAVEAVIDGNFPKKLKDELSQSRKYAEGRGLQVEVKTEEELSIVIDLIDIKYRN